MQDGRLIGAVTHVLLNDLTRGDREYAGCDEVVGKLKMECVCLG